MNSSNHALSLSLSLTHTHTHTHHWRTHETTFSIMPDESQPQPADAEVGEDELAPLRKLYYDPSAGLWSINKLHDKLKAQGVRLSLKTIRQFLRDQEVAQVFHERRIKTYFPLIADAPFQRIQVDLLDVSNENYVRNRNVHFLFVCIDVYTRYVIVVPQRNKSEAECTRSLRRVLQEITELVGPYGVPSQMDSDNEPAFLSRGFKRLCAENHLEQHLNVPGDYKSKGIVERFNRTLRSLLQKFMVAFHTEVWIDKLPELVCNYNNTNHRTLKKTPTQAIENNDTYEKDRAKQIAKAKKQPFNRDVIEVGDKIRVLLKKGVFDKGTEPRWSKHVSSVERADNGEYFVKERKQPYRKAELLKVDRSEQWNAGLSLPLAAAAEDALLVNESGEDADREPPAPASTTSTTAELRRAKRIRRALNQEGVSEREIRHSRRSRQPANLLVSDHGERIIWS
jgi:transposase InsO family protein